MCSAMTVPGAGCSFRSARFTAGDHPERSSETGTICQVLTTSHERSEAARVGHPFRNWRGLGPCGTSIARDIDLLPRDPLRSAYVAAGLCLHTCFQEERHAL